MKISVLDSALQLPVISTTAANLYCANMEKMEKLVGAELSRNEHIGELIGYNSLSLMSM